MATRNLLATKSTALILDDGVAKGGGTDLHLPIGYAGGSNRRFRAAIRFGMDWTDVTQIVSAVLHIKTTQQEHVTFGTDPDIYIGRLTAAFTANSARPSSEGGSGWSTDDDDYNSIAGVADQIAFDTGTATGTWESYDITPIVERWALASILKSDGVTYGDAATNYGIRIDPVTAGDSTENIEYWSYESTAAPYIVLTYLTNSPPYPAQHVSIGGITSDGQAINDTTPTVITEGDGDPNGDTWLTNSGCQVEVAQCDNGYGTIPTGGTTAHYYTMSLNGSKWHGEVTVSSALTRGKWYRFRPMFIDEHGSGVYGTSWWMYVSVVPTAPTLPANGSTWEVWNLEDTSTWTSGGNHAKPAFALTASGSIKAWEVRIKSSAGGTVVGTGSGSGNWVDGETIDAECNVALVNGTTYYADARIQNTFDEWSSYSTEVNGKVRWAQAIYEVNTGSGSGGYGFTPGALTGTEPRAGFLFRTATGSGGAGAGTWYTNIGSLASASWVNVLVRLATGQATSAASSPALADMTVSYSASPSSPDNWTAGGSGTSDWSLDTSVRRYGTQSMRCLVTTASQPTSHYIDATARVLPNQQYTLSAWVKTSGSLSRGNLRIQLIHTSTVSSSSITTTASAPDGWQRISVTTTIPSGVTSVTVRVLYSQTVATAGDMFWVDAVQLEEGPVASSWSPGMVGAVTLDANGIAVDGVAGGMFRLRGSNNTSRDTVVLGTKGLLFGGDTDVYSDTADTLVIENAIKLPVDGLIVIDERAADPSTPATGFWSIYAKSGGLYVIDDVGTVTGPLGTGGGGGAPTTVNYLVGTADGTLSNEIVVGTTPGGELGGTWASPTVAATHSGSAHHAQSHNHSASGDGTSLSPATLILPGATGPAQTAEGSVVWDTDTEVLTIGDGTSRRTFGYIGSGTPATQAYGDSPATGTSNEAARLDHKHGMPAAGSVTYEVPAFTFSTTNAVGNGGGAINSAATIAIFDTTNPSTQAFGDSATVGTAGFAARRDHKHAMMANPVTTHESSYTHTNIHAQSHNHSAAGDGTSLSPATLILPGATGPAQTAEGSVVWDTDTEVLTIGDGTSRRTFGYIGTGTPSTQAYSDSPSTGTSNEAARLDHKHGMPAAGSITYATPALVFGTSNSVGNGSGPLNAAAGIAIFDTTNPSTQAFGDSATVGTAAFAARRDHKHAMMANPTTSNMDGVARTTVRKNTGTDVGSRRRLNFIEGTNITLTVADDSTNEEVDITITASSTATETSYGCRAYRNTAQSLSNTTEAAINLTSESYDDDTMHDNSTNSSRIYLKKAGRWALTGCVGFSANGTGTRGAYILLDATTYLARARVGANTAQAHRVVVTTIVDISGTTSYITLQGEQNSGGSLDTASGADETWLAAEWLGD